VPDDEREDHERRSHDRVAVSWDVDCATEETFLYASIANISAMGIFIRTEKPLDVGTPVDLSFAPPKEHGHEPFRLHGVVAWINRVRENGDNPNPGMGVRFTDLSQEARERLVDVIHAITYVREPN
jgi:type IV pilus assembly protein PilZ